MAKRRLHLSSFQAVLGAAPRRCSSGGLLEKGAVVDIFASVHSQKDSWFTILTGQNILIPLLVSIIIQDNTDFFGLPKYHQLPMLNGSFLYFQGHGEVFLSTRNRE